jgi:acetylornithine deacetylase
MMAELIARPSVSCVSPQLDQSNQGVIDVLADWLADLGFDIEVIPVTDQPKKSNLIATLGTGPGGLVFSGHTDTVPYDERRWNHNPFALSEDSDRFYGLGTSDMKGFFAIAIDAIRDLRAGDLEQPVIVLATSDEESSMDGAKTLVRLGKPKARYAVIGEPTNLRPIYAHKGIMMEAVRVRGQSGHSSDPLLGHNALEGMSTVLVELLAWRDELQQRYTDPAFAVPFPTLNPGHIHGGDNPNRICAECELHFDLRPLPGMSLESLRDEFRQRLQTTFASSPLVVETFPLVEGTQPMLTDKTSAIAAACERLTGHAVETAAYCTEGPYLNELGMDSMVLGPGHIDQAHKPDEFLSAGSIPPMRDMLIELVTEFCLRPQP